MHAPPSSTRAHAQGVSPAAGAYSDSEDDLPQQTGNGQASRLIRQPSGPVLIPSLIQRMVCHSRLALVKPAD